MNHFNFPVKELIKSISYKRFKVTIKFNNDVNFLFFHGSKLYDLICKTMKRGVNKLGEDIIINAVESGRTSYQSGDCYNFGITAINAGDYFIDHLESKLKSISSYIPKENSIEGIFTLEDITEIKTEIIPDFTDGGEEEYELWLRSPLRMVREYPVPGHKYFDREYFDIRQFLKLLYYRVKRLSILCGNSVDECDPSLEFLHCAVNYINLMWLDMPYTSKTLGGVSGKVKFTAELSADLKLLLWFGQFINNGNNTSFGFGKNSVTNIPGYNVSELSPYETFLAKAVKKENVLNAYKVLASDNSLTISDKLKVKKFNSKINENLDNLINEVITGKYEAKPFTGTITEEHDGINIHTEFNLEERTLQLAVKQIAEPVINKYIGESSFFYRNGFSKEGALKMLDEAEKNGYEYNKIDIDSFYSYINKDVLYERIETLFGGDPVSDLIRVWITQPVCIEGNMVTSYEGIPYNRMLNPMLINLYLDRLDEMLPGNCKLIKDGEDLYIIDKNRNLH
ncbi:MAG: CRISPR system precrRNA processing endoribonuclease RAMP protein Cas6 [Ignavibacteriae bacterium]|nr:MAG: CRISPR system precrRNA processing endoribonuclease RAMP protein Cas6 [Ignavibacteriota bacterium]